MRRDGCICEGIGLPLDHVCVDSPPPYTSVALPPNPGRIRRSSQRAPISHRRAAASSSRKNLSRKHAFYFGYLLGTVAVSLVFIGYHTYISKTTIASGIPLACDPKNLSSIETTCPADLTMDYDLDLVYGEPEPIGVSDSHQAGGVWYHQKMRYVEVQDRQEVTEDADGQVVLRVTRTAIERKILYTYLCNYNAEGKNKPSKDENKESTKDENKGKTKDENKDKTKGENRDQNKTTVWKINTNFTKSVEVKGEK